jgi:hypothetical protein
MGTVRKGLLLVFVVLLILAVGAGAAFAKPPSKVLIVVMDQMQPEYAQQYDMSHVLWLQNRGINFPNAYVGDMASETVVSHNVMVSGLFPQHMGWPDEVMRLTAPLTDGAGGSYPAGSIVTVGDLGYAQYKQLIEDLGYPKLGDYLHEKFPGTKVANVGQKGYQVESMAASSSDIYVRMGSKKAANPALTGLPGSYRGPSGAVPTYISSDPRYYVSVGNDNTFDPPADYYGTKSDKPAWLYPEDGRYVPSPYTDPANYHESGDAWVADAAIEIMQNEDWSGLFVTFSAMDKIGHMWGGGQVDDLQHYTWDPSSMFDWVHMPFVARNADAQLGRLIDTLKELEYWDDTLVIVTADHGATDSGEKGEGYRGVNAYDGGNLSWYYDPNKTAVNTTYGRPPVTPGTITNNEAVLGGLNATGNVAYSYQSTAIETWLIDTSWDKKVEMAEAMAGLPDVIATYVKSEDGKSYVQHSAATDVMSESEMAWWSAHGQELVDTMACAGSAEVVGLLKDRVSYGVYGDHGGAQESVQRIPMSFYMPGIRHSVKSAGFRLADLMPTVLKALRIDLDQPVDGQAYSLWIRGHHK